MNSGRVRVGRLGAAFGLSVVLFLSVLHIGGDTLLGDAWGGYIRGEAEARLHPGAGIPETVTVAVPDLTACPFSVDCLDGTVFGLSVTYVESELPPRTVLAQSPPPGSLRKAVPGRIRIPVNVSVSTGSRTACVPEVLGMDGRQAAAELRRLGFSVRTARLMQDDAHSFITADGIRFRYVPRGTFTAPMPGDAVFTEPEAGSVRKAGTEVTLYLMDEKPTVSPVCPDVVGMTLAEAERVLSEAGIRVGQVLEEAGAGLPGIVAAQSRLARTRLSPDDCIDLTIVKEQPTRRHFWEYWPFINSKG